MAQTGKCDDIKIADTKSKFEQARMCTKYTQLLTVYNTIPNPKLDYNYKNVHGKFTCRV